MAQSDQHRCLLLATVSSEIPGYPRLTLEKTSWPNLRQKQLKTKTGDICVVWWSKPLGDYIVNFYRPKEVSCKKTESGGHTRCPWGRGAPSTLVDASCPFRTTSYFPKFLNFPKWRKIAIRTVLESVYLPYHIPIPFRSLKHSGKCPICIPPGLRFQ